MIRLKVTHAPYDLYGATAQQIEVLQPSIFNPSAIGSSTTISSKVTQVHTILFIWGDRSADQSAATTFVIG
jgi:hypothetical protein